MNGSMLRSHMKSMRSNLNEPIPGHLKSYWYALGGTPAFLLIVQVITGILLTLFSSAIALPMLVAWYYDEATMATFGTGFAITLIKGIVQYQIPLIFSPAQNTG